MLSSLLHIIYDVMLRGRVRTSELNSTTYSRFREYIPSLKKRFCPIMY